MNNATNLRLKFNPRLGQFNPELGFNPLSNNRADVIIAEDQGFHCSDSGQAFVQIVIVRENDWVTVSNLLNAPGITCVYDSLHTLNVKAKEEKINYPMTVDLGACQISRCEKSFTMVVENVQQQNRGEDCGLFAIAYAALLCIDQDPAKAVINQNIMLQELMQSLQDTDITRFVNNVTKIDESKVQKIRYQWTCKVYCICHMPDDGSKMVQCSKCKTWYHQNCVRGDFSKREWPCPKCEFTVTGHNAHGGACNNQGCLC